jgi:hypothetical protein
LLVELINLSYIFLPNSWKREAPRILGRKIGKPILMQIFFKIGDQTNTILLSPPYLKKHNSFSMSGEAMGSLSSELRPKPQGSPDR